MKKQILSEEFKRMQKLAGIINEVDSYADIDARLQAYVKDKFPSQNWMDVKNYYLEMTQDKPESEKAYFELVDGILKKEGY